MNKCSLVRGNPNACINCADYDDCPDSVEIMVKVVSKEEELEKPIKKKVSKKKGKGKK